jgi:hypothetical protein
MPPIDKNVKQVEAVFCRQTNRKRDLPEPRRHAVAQCLIIALFLPPGREFRAPATPVFRPHALPTLDIYIKC